MRGDDIDLAIQVTVGSFVNAQKMSIKKTLERVSAHPFRSLEPSLSDADYSAIASFSSGIPKVPQPGYRS